MTDTSTDKCIPNNCKLLRKTDLEPCFWINEHVHTGYRPPHLSTMQYVKWIFQWNNETINIWTHLIGFFYFTWRQYTTNVYFLPATNANPTDYIIISACLFGLQICMLLSTFYHVFGAINAEQRRRFLRLDTFGISAGLISIYLLGIYTAFLCFEKIKVTIIDHSFDFIFVAVSLSNVPYLILIVINIMEWQNHYFAFLFGISLVAVYLPLSNNIRKVVLFGSPFKCTHLIYLTIVTLGFGPTIHWIFLHGGISSEHVMEWLPNLFVLYATSGSAFLFYISMFPERLKPGVFDLVGYSHQWWHLLIFIAMWYWQNSMLDYLATHRLDSNYCLISNRLSNITSAT